MPNVPPIGPLGHQEGPTLSWRPKSRRADTKPHVWVSPCTGEGDSVHGRPILNVAYTIEPVFVHGRLSRCTFGAKRQGLQARKAASAASPFPEGRGLGMG